MKILPNDDLVLNQARRQKSFAASNSGPAAKKINQLKNSAENKVNLQRASSMGHLEKPEEKIVRVRSLVEVDDYDGKVFFLTSNHLNFCPILSLYVQSIVLWVILRDVMKRRLQEPIYNDVSLICK